MYNEKITGYCIKIPYNPPEKYPELPFIMETNKNNMVYPMIRNLLIKLRLDESNIGCREWNPFKDIVKPGNRVLIKPNLVLHRHYLGEKALHGSIVHGSVIRPLVDYVYKALAGNGEIFIADNPVAGADFKAIMDFTGIQEMIDCLSQYGYSAELKVIDLRPKVSVEAKNGSFFYKAQAGDPLGYVTVDLGKNSLFAEFDNVPNVHYYTLADQAVDHLDPKCSRLSTTDKYHNSNSHKYVVSRSILDTDVLIDLAKMKTHCKAGVSLTLKNMIGMVYLKECIPHHRPGLPPQGDSFPDYPAPYFIHSRNLYVKLRRLIRIHRFPGFRHFRNYLQKKQILINSYIEHGNWKGNDTIWRTILDLNRIAMYADKNGKMHDVPQRKIFYCIDGIIAQQGDGPINGEPFNASIVFGGSNSVFVDTLAVESMGFDPMMISSISQAYSIQKWKLINNNDVVPVIKELKLPQFNFQMSKGWE
ncbi:DUF362 domain-containing protein [Acidobacteriota bacterium]